MTDYVTLYVKKRGFTINSSIPDLSDNSVVKINADDVRITRNGDIRIARNGDIRITHNTSLVYPRLLKTRKRNYSIRGKVKHG